MVVHNTSCDTVIPVNPLQNSATVTLNAENQRSNADFTAGPLFSSVLPVRALQTLGYLFGAHTAMNTFKGSFRGRGLRRGCRNISEITAYIDDDTPAEEKNVNAPFGEQPKVAAVTAAQRRRTGNEMRAGPDEEPTTTQNMANIV